MEKHRVPDTGELVNEKPKKTSTEKKGGVFLTAFTARTPAYKTRVLDSGYLNLSWQRGPKALF